MNNETKKKIIEWLKDNIICYYADRNDYLSIKQVKKLMEDYQLLEEEIGEFLIDWQSEEELQLMETLQKTFPELEKYEKSDLREEMMDYIQYDIDFLKGAIKNTPSVNIRVEIKSEMESLIDHTILLNNENSVLQQQLKLYHGKTENGYYNQLAKLLKGKFTINSMEKELSNCTTYGNKLIFYFQTDVENLINIHQKKWSKIKIPKNVMCGLFDSLNGDGSLLEIELTKDFWLKRQHGKTKYDIINIVLDEANRYSVKETYGLCNVPKIELEVK